MLPTTSSADTTRPGGTAHACGSLRTTTSSAWPRWWATGFKMPAQRCWLSPKLTAPPRQHTKLELRQRRCSQPPRPGTRSSESRRLVPCRTWDDQQDGSTGWQQPPIGVPLHPAPNPSSMGQRPPGVKRAIARQLRSGSGHGLSQAMLDTSDLGRQAETLDTPVDGQPYRRIGKPALSKPTILQGQRQRHAIGDGLANGRRLRTQLPGPRLQRHGAGGLDVARASHLQA